MVTAEHILRTRGWQFKSQEVETNRSEFIAWHLSANVTFLAAT